MKLPELKSGIEYWFHTKTNLHKRKFLHFDGDFAVVEQVKKKPQPPELFNMWKIERITEV